MAETMIEAAWTDRVPLSAFLPVSASPRPRVSESPCPRVSASDKAVLRPKTTIHFYRRPTYS